MNYTIEKLSDEPIVIAVNSAYLGPAEGQDFIAALVACLDAQTEKVYLISDVSAVQLNVNDLIEGASQMSRGQKPPFRHPKIIENVLVTTSGIAKLAAKGLSSPIFGGVQMVSVDTQEEALAYCRSKLAGG
jgi:hypothetical protein